MREHAHELHLSPTTCHSGEKHSPKVALILVQNQSLSVFSSSLCSQGVGSQPPTVVFGNWTVSATTHINLSSKLNIMQEFTIRKRQFPLLRKWVGVYFKTTYHAEEQLQKKNSNSTLEEMACHVLLQNFLVFPLFSFLSSCWRRIVVRRGWVRFTPFITLAQWE